jgi:hypothetical protein
LKRVNATLATTILEADKVEGLEKQVRELSKDKTESNVCGSQISLTVGQIAGAWRCFRKDQVGGGHGRRFARGTKEASR